MRPEAALISPEQRSRCRSTAHPAQRMRASIKTCAWERNAPPWAGMPTPTEQNFLDYKRAEKKALELLATMKTVTPRAADIELALLVAIFELHKQSLPPTTIASIIHGHVKELVAFYGGAGGGGGGSAPVSNQ